MMAGPADTPDRLADAPLAISQSSGATAKISPRFNLQELAGSLGDLGTFLPLAVAMALVCRMDIGVIFIFAGLMNVASGWWFSQPLPVQPMKAIAAVAIAEGLSPGAIASAGMVMGMLVLAIALVGAADWLTRVIPKEVVRGIQAGVGIKLAITGILMMGVLPAWGWNSLLVAVAAGLMVVLMMGRRQPTLLYVFLSGFALLWWGRADVPWVNVAHVWDVKSLGEVGLVLPSSSEWWTGLTRGALPQLPLTLLNSVVAVCALSEDYFPGRGIKPKRMAASVGVMNLLCVPWGGMPMCHGSGGLAAQYQFGARTGGSVIMLGAIKIIAGVLFGSVLLSTLSHYPGSILGVMIVTAGLSLAWAGRRVDRQSGLLVVCVMIFLIVIFNTLAGFVAGCMLAGMIAVWRHFKRKSHGGARETNHVSDVKEIH